jgi:hypothetical protein
MKRRISTGLGLGVILCVILAGIVWADGMTIVSDTSVMAYGPLTSYAGPGDVAWGTGAPALATWVHPSWPTISGATWISTDYYVEEWNEDSWRWFRRTFELCPGAYNISASVLAATSDNAERVWFNGTYVGEDGEVEGAYIDNAEWGTVKSYTLPSPQPGVNTLDFIVRNYACYYPTRSGSYSCTGAEPWEQNPTGLIFKVVVTYDCPIQVTVDIKPGSDPNSINLNSRGVVPVAVLTTDDFDASTVDPVTVLFAGASPLRWAMEDVDGDGDMDLLFHFKTQELGLDENSTEAILTGSTFGGQPIQGTDTVNIVPPAN